MTEIVKASLEHGVQKIRITADKGYHPAHIQLQFDLFYFPVNRMPGDRVIEEGL